MVESSEDECNLFFRISINNKPGLVARAYQKDIIDYEAISNWYLFLNCCGSPFLNLYFHLGNTNPDNRFRYLLPNR